MVASVCLAWTKRLAQLGLTDGQSAARCTCIPKADCAEQFKLPGLLSAHVTASSSCAHLVHALHCNLALFWQLLQRALTCAQVAHKKLLDAHNHLRGIGQEVPQELFQALAVIHSYILVRARVQLGDHEGAARLLVRVADHISRFERHTVPILTSCVIECQRAGLKRSAHDVASTLMRKEYRDQIAPAHKRKIESIVRPTCTPFPVQNAAYLVRCGPTVPPCRVPPASLRAAVC